MASINDEIIRLETAKSDIETAIETCGVNVPDTELIDTYSTYIRQIPSAVFSSFNVNATGGTDKYIQSIKQANGLIETTVGGLVSTSSSGLVPKADAFSGVIDTQSTDWVLTNKNGTIDWYKLPVNAYLNDKVTQTVTSSSNTSWRPVLLGYSYSDSDPFAPDIVTNSIYASHLIKVKPSTGELLATTFTGNLKGNADTATKLGLSTVGSTTTPIYLNAGVPTAIDTKNYLKCLQIQSNLTSSGWYRIGTLTGYRSYLFSITGSYNSVNSTACSFIINKSYSNITISQIGKANIVNMVSKVRLVKDESSANTIYLDVYNNYNTTTDQPFYYSLTPLSQPYVNIGASLQDPILITDDVVPISEINILTNYDVHYASNADTVDGKHASAFALATDVPVVTEYYWANINIKDSADTTTTPTFGAVTTSVCLFKSRGDGVVKIQCPDELSKGINLNLPSVSGLLICHTNDTAVGSATNPVYIAAAGLATACRYSLNATVNSSTAAPKLAYYSSTTEISAYTSSSGTVRRPIYLNAGVPTPITISASTSSTLYLVGITSSTSGFYSGTQSASGVRITGGNTLCAYGGFFESSDNKLKDFKKDVVVDLEKLSLLPKKYFTWKSDETNKLNIGTSAQELLKIYPELVSEDDEGLLNVAYDKLSIIALAAIDKLYEENNLLKSKIVDLETRILNLEKLTSLSYGNNN